MSKIIEEKNNNDFKTVYLDINEYNNIIEYTNLTNLFYIDLQLDTTRVNITFIILRVMYNTLMCASHSKETHILYKHILINL